VEDRLFREIVHMIGHLTVYSLLLWQIVLGTWLILKWVNKNWKIKKTFSVVSPTENKTQPVQPVINIDGTSIGEGIAKKKKDMGPVDVDINRNVFVDKIEGGRIEMDEIKKGKVKTQKNKLKKLRGK
jgi:hypothetical protein